ncbi:MAG: alkaline phosphatase family protein [Actinomycetota bacterium]
MADCRQWADRSVLVCKAWAEEKRQECIAWGDEGQRECAEWEEERYRDCCDWWPCSWACDAWVWVSSWVCKAWYWVAKWVCYGWTWVVTAVCVVWGWVTVTACGLWSILVCAIRAIIDWFASLFGGDSEERPRIEHVFVLMLENRSFDHMLGLSEIRGVDAVTHGPTVIDGVQVGAGFTNPDPNAPTNPADVHAGAAFAIAKAVKDPGHEFDDVLMQLTSRSTYASGSPYPLPPAPGSNRGFVSSYVDRGSSAPRSIMDCYTPDQLPVLTTLAREFAVCDAWFSSLPGPTFPNRFFVHAASSGGLDDSPAGWEIGINTLLDGFRFNNATIFEALDAKCIDWEVVEGDEFPAVASLAGMTFNAVVRDRFTDFDDFVARLSGGGDAPPYVFIEPDYGNVLPLTSEDFTCGNSQHPIDDVTAGERLIKDTYEAIRNSKLWETSMLIVTWDEHGGFYDHVRPGPAVPPGDGVSTSGNVRHGFGFDQLGVRVPAVVVSPLVPRNTIDHTVYDHSSIPATLERNFGLEPLTARDAAANDVVHLLSLTTPRTTEAEAPTRLPEPATSVFRCVGVFDLIADTHAEEIAEVKGAAEAPAEPGPEKVDHRAEITRRRRAKEPLRSKEEGSELGASRSATRRLRSRPTCAPSRWSPCSARSRCSDDGMCAAGSRCLSATCVGQTRRRSATTSRASAGSSGRGKARPRRCHASWNPRKEERLEGSPALPLSTDHDSRARRARPADRLGALSMIRRPASCRAQLSGAVHARIILWTRTLFSLAAASRQMAVSQVRRFGRRDTLGPDVSAAPSPPLLDRDALKKARPLSCVGILRPWRRERPEGLAGELESPLGIGAQLVCSNREGVGRFTERAERTIAGGRTRFGDERSVASSGQDDPVRFELAIGPRDGPAGHT